jgi:hypothetical protein
MLNRQFVLTSVNVERLHEHIGTRDPVFEIVGKPYDLERITRAVKEASRARSMDYLAPVSTAPESRDQASDDSAHGDRAHRETSKRRVRHR